MVTLALWLLVGFNQGEILVKDQRGGWSKRCKEMSSPASQWYCQNLCPSQPQHLSCHWSCFHTLPTLHTWTTLSSLPALALASNYVGCRSSRLTLAVKNPPANAGDIRDLSSSPESGRSPRGGNGNPLQYSCLENPMDGGAWCGLQSTRSQRVGHYWATSLSLSQLLYWGKEIGDWVLKMSSFSVIFSRPKRYHNLLKCLYIITPVLSWT